MTRTRLILGIVGLKVGWLSCVLGAAHGLPALGPVVVALIAAAYLARSPQRRADLALVSTAAMLGYGVDSLLVLAGVISFPEPAVLGAPSPVWMVALWVNLALTLRGVLGWLRNRLMLAAFVGAVSGAGAYWGGARLDAIVLDRTGSLVLVAAAWLVALPALMVLERTTRRRDDTRGAAVAPAPFVEPLKTP